MATINCPLKSQWQESARSCYLPEKGVGMLGEKKINFSQIMLPQMLTFNSFCTPPHKEIVRDLTFGNATGSLNPKFWSANCSGPWSTW